MKKLLAPIGLALGLCLIVAGITLFAVGTFAEKQATFQTVETVSAADANYNTIKYLQGIQLIEDGETVYERLFAKAVADVEALTGEQLLPAPELVFVDSFASIVSEQKWAPVLPSSAALRVSNMVVVKRKPVTGIQAYHVLVYTLLRMHVDRPIPTWKTVTSDFMRACDDALIMRYAAELTGKRYGTPAAYHWDLMEGCVLESDFIVRLAMERPEKLLVLARDVSAADDMIDHVLAREMTHIVSNESDVVELEYPGDPPRE